MHGVQRPDEAGVFWVGDMSHMTDFLSKQTGDWTEGKFCHTLASSGGSSNNFGILGGKSPPCG
jgi:hypothetical protein